MMDITGKENNNEGEDHLDYYQLQARDSNKGAK